MIMLIGIIYIILSIIIGCNKFEKYIRYLNYMLTIPEGDVELYKLKEPRIVTPLTILFLPSLVMFIICEEHYYK